MSEDWETNGADGARYCDLVRLAYFVLPGNGRRMYRLAMARRIAEGACVRRTRRAEARSRTRVLRRAMRPPRRLQIGLGPWLRALPVRLPDRSVTGALSRLEPRVRVAYALRRVEGLPRYAVRDQLAALRIRDPWAVIEEAEAVRVHAPEGPDGPFAPEFMVPVRRRSPVPVAAAAALTLSLVGTLVVTESGASFFGIGRPAAARNLRLVAAAPDAWTRGARTLDAWPARGGLAGDKAFTRRALDAWAGRGVPVERDRAGTAQLLFAGRVDGAAVALLRHGDRVARYARVRGRDQVETFVAGGDPSAPVGLGGGRYLLSPWDTEVRLPGGARRVAVRDGVTEPVEAGTRCGRGPLLEVTGPDGARTVGDLGGRRPVVLVHRSPSHRPASKERPPERLKPSGLRIWDRLACLLPQPARPVAEAAAWEFWSGRLPEKGGAGRWVCTGMMFAGGGTAAQGALLAERSTATGWCDESRPVSGTWWQAPSGDWHYLAAAARGFAPHAEGLPEPGKVRRGLLLAPAPDPKTRPDLPVTLTARPA